MPRYNYTARSSAGTTERGAREAASEAALLEDLRRGGLLALEVARAPGDGSDGAPPATPSLGLRLRRLFPPTATDVELALQQMAFMLKSGLPLLRTLRTTAEQSTGASTAYALSRVADRVQSGVSLSDALSEHRCFPPLVIAMAGVGERTGDLSEPLGRAARALERGRALRAGVLTALAYPSIVVVLAVCVVAYIMVSLIPKLRVFLSGFGRRLPPMTQLLVDISTAVHENLLTGGVALAFVALVVATVYSWPPGRLRIDRAALRLPIVGDVLRIAATALFARTLGTLLGSGIRLTDALGIAEPLHENRWVRDRIALARERVLEGATIAEPLAAGGVFLPVLPSMVAVGEASGTLDEVLVDVAVFHEARLEAVIRRLGALVEPAVILVVGGIVGFVYISFFMALYAIAGGRT